MNFCFIVRSLMFQRPTHTTIHLAYEAWRRNHRVVFASIHDFTCTEQRRILANVVETYGVPLSSREQFSEYLSNNRGRKTEVCLNDFDVVFLRYNALDLELEKPKSTSPILDFCRILKSQGVLVVNDPAGLQRASSKIYLSSFPSEIRAQTLITRNARKAKEFLKQLKKPAIIKPVSGFGGRDVFFIGNYREININQIISSVRKNGYLIVQEYLPEAKKGDKRLLLMNGSPIYSGSQVAIYRRISPKGDIRNNIHVGGVRKRARFSSLEAGLVEIIRPKLIADGLYFVGVDTVGSRLLEINTFCPGGIHNINELYNINVGETVIRDLEKRVRLGRPHSSFVKSASHSLTT